MSEAAPFTLRKSGRYSLFAAPFVLIGGLWATPGLMVYDAIKPTAPEVATAPAPDGHKLFLRHCANCHGANGDGQGTAHLNPAARHFGYQPFKFATTAAQKTLGYKFAAPTDDNLLAVLKRGIPGSSMPAFQNPPKDAPPATQVYANLSDDELRAIIGHVRALARKGVYEKLVTRWPIQELKKVMSVGDDEKDEAKALAEAVPEDWAEARKVPPRPDKLLAATDLLTAVPAPLAVPAALPPGDPTNGKQVFVKATCASCHGAGGKGDGEQFKEPGPGQPDKRPKNTDGTPAYPRDLTAGVYKGGGDAASLYARIRLGIHGTPMPASEPTAVSEKELVDLIAFVQSLKQPAAQ